MLTMTAIRKLKTGDTVRLVAAPHVRFTRQEDGQWAEVPRMRVTPRVLGSGQLFLLGVEPVKEDKS